MVETMPEWLRPFEGRVRIWKERRLVMTRAFAAMVAAPAGPEGDAAIADLVAALGPYNEATESLISIWAQAMEISRADAEELVESLVVEGEDAEFEALTV